MLVRRPRLRVATCVLLLALAGCGSGHKSPGSTDADASTAPNQGSTAASGTESGTGDGPQKICDLVTAAEFSTAIGSKVTTTVGPTGDCEFDQDDPRALSGSVGVVPYAATNGGYPAYVSGLNATLTHSTEHPLSDLGKEAVVKIGVPSFGSGENLMAGGVVDYGGYLLQVTLVQGVGMPESDLVSTAEKLLRLVDSRS